jgi:hypothetical protein
VALQNISSRECRQAVTTAGARIGGASMTIDATLSVFSDEIVLGVS